MSQITHVRIELTDLGTIEEALRQMGYKGVTRRGNRLSHGGINFISKEDGTVEVSGESGSYETSKVFVDKLKSEYALIKLSQRAKEMGFFVGDVIREGSRIELTIENVFA